MKNNIFLLIAASIFILSFSSCDDLLDVTPKDKITPETFFSTEADLQAFSTNFYNSLPKDRLLILNLHIRLKILINTFRFHKIFNQ